MKRTAAEAEIAAESKTVASADRPESPVPARTRRTTAGGSTWASLLRAGKFLYPIVVVALVWQLIASLHIVSPLLFPPVTQVISSLYQGLITGTTLWPDVAITLERAGIGFIIAVVVGIAVGLLMNASKGFRGFIDPLISITFPMPKLALFPILLVWFGVGDLTKIILVAFGAVFPVIVNTYTASTSVPRALIWNARSKGASRFQVLIHVVLPWSMPSIFAGIRIASSMSFLLAVSAEIISSSSGLGFLIMSSEQSFQPAQTVAAIALTGILGLVIDRIVYGLQRFSSRWQESA
jgi:ABC-type nitrate/sulfonate/bicarbonate transport system permease component